jgi:Cu2+-exporting ATPase
VQVVAQSLAITDFSADVTPVGKQAYVAELQAAGATVLMVGDGVNDAPVLASADVSMAAGEATALARTAADVISLLPGLEGLERLLAKSSRTMKIVRQNLAWAALYNATAIPLAALGLVPPWAAAIGMAGSSLLVVSNAQRLWSSTASVSSDSSHRPRSRLWNRFSF